MKEIIINAWKAFCMLCVFALTVFFVWCGAYCMENGLGSTMGYIYFVESAIFYGILMYEIIRQTN